MIFYDLDVYCLVMSDSCLGPPPLERVCVFFSFLRSPNSRMLWGQPYMSQSRSGEAQPILPRFQVKIPCAKVCRFTGSHDFPCCQVFKLSDFQLGRFQTSQLLKFLDMSRFPVPEPSFSQRLDEQLGRVRVLSGRQW